MTKIQGRTLAILAAVLGVLTALALWDDRQTAREEKAEADKNKLVTLQASDIVRIELERSGEDDDEGKDDGDADPAGGGGKKAVGAGPLKAVLSRQSGEGRWRIESPVAAEADTAAVSSWLDRIVDSKYERVLEGAAARRGEFGLDKPYVQLRLIKEGQESSQALVVAVGAKAAVGYSTYVWTSESPDAVLLASQSVRMSLSKSLFELRDKAFLTWDPSKLTELTVESADKGRPAIRGQRGDTSAPWTLTVGSSAVPLDEEVWRSYLSDLVAMRATAFHDDRSEAEKAWSGAKVLGRLAWTGEGGSGSVDIREAASGLLLRVSNHSTQIEVTTDTKSRWFKSADDLRDRRLVTFSMGEVQEVVVDGQVSERVQSDWYTGAEAQKAKAGEQGAQKDARIGDFLTTLEKAKFDKEVRPSEDKGIKDLMSKAPQSVVLRSRPDLNREPLEIKVWRRDEVDTPSDVVVQISGRAGVLRVGKYVFAAIAPVAATPVPSEGEKSGS